MVGFETVTDVVLVTAGRLVGDPVVVIPPFASETTMVPAVVLMVAALATPASVPTGALPVKVEALRLVTWVVLVTTSGAVPVAMVDVS